MSAHNIYAHMRDGGFPASGSFGDTGSGVLFAWGPTAPADAATGYAKGCIFLDTTNGINLVNSGTNASASFTGESGAVNGTGVTAVESTGAVNKTVITLADHAMALTDEAVVVAYAGSKLYDFPAGATYILGAVADLALTLSAAGVNANWNGDFGIGTVTASNNGTLATTEQNIIPTTATPQAVASATTATGQSTAAEHAVYDGTTTPVDAYLNILVDDADHDVTTTATDIIVNGTVTLTWINLGNY